MLVEFRLYGSAVCPHYIVLVESRGTDGVYQCAGGVLPVAAMLAAAYRHDRGTTAVVI